MFAILFDIDGTLINTGGAGGTALLKAFSEEFGVETPERVPFAGRTDRGIAANLFRIHEVPNTPENWDRLRLGYLRELVVQLPLHEGQVLPGVEQVLAALAARDDVHLGLLTGNVREGARTKLEHYRLFQHFSFGGFGDLHADRDDVAREALRETRTRLDQHFHPERLWVVGDTPLDIRCARAIGARVIAVGTGGHCRDELKQAGPDLLVEDLSDATEVLRRMLL
ncbi:MAG: HAD family hydrolase [Planctomycetales bacterium]|nr:HAD family hydrolase [Planctomycetales bacterium]